MSVSGDDVKIPLRVAINRQNTKALFAEVDRDFVDVLLSFLALPLGRIVKLFQKHYGDAAPSVGSLNNLYSSLANLDDAHFWTKECKLLLLDPKSMLMLSSGRGIKLNIVDSPLPTKYYTCETTFANYYPGSACNRISILRDSICTCGKFMSKELSLSKSSLTTKSFVVSDDLQILTDASVFLLQKVQRFGISNIEGMTTRSAQLGVDSAMEMLKTLFVSQTPLTDFVLSIKRQASSKCNFGQTSVSSSSSSSSKKFIIKALLQKSTGKLLFVQAKDDFVDFLFGLLAIPLSALANLLGGSTPFLGVNNLYQSVFSLDQDNHLMSSEEKTLLLKLPIVYASTNNILPLCWESMDLKLDGSRQLVKPPKVGYSVSCVDYVGGNRCYIRGPSMFKVSDDLTVTPSTMLSDISHLIAMNIPLSDVKEVELDVGVKEALRILNASLTSTTVLTDALSLNQPKQELDKSV